MTSFRFLRALSFTNSLVFTGLLVFWIARGFEPETRVFGWAHGSLWIVLSLLCLASLRRRTIPFWLAVVVAVIGGVGPFAGSIGFVLEGRRRGRSATPGPPGAPAQVRR